MNLSLSNTLGKRMALASLDPDAKGYIDAVVAAGATVSGGQKSAINTFVKTGKADGWYSSLKRLYLPIWAAAAPNAICMTSLTSGTFVGGVTHGAGFVQGDGSTGYFDFGTNFATSGIAPGSGYLFGLNTTLTVGEIIGSFTDATVSGVELRNTSGGNFTQYGSSTARVIDSKTVGIQSLSVVGTTMSLANRSASERSVVSNNVANLTISPDMNVNAMRRHRPEAAGGGDLYSGARFGAFGAGDGMVDDDDSAFTANLKTLWETCTGLTLP